MLEVYTVYEILLAIAVYTTINQLSLTASYTQNDIRN
jgi:hypothetical protein